MKRFSVVAVVVAAISILAGGAASANVGAQDDVEAAEACAAAQRPGSVLATPQCTYLEKCCGGNTPNAPKCCEGYFKKCGGGKGQ
ncbi:MAG: hypothetical protein JNL38_35420 [Myxococcales bacterium]|jgi:hypothetical protein|nr:hypothetical protein [Myxococcales bacterium]